MSIFKNQQSHMSDFDNVAIEENEDLIMIIEGPNTNRTIFISLSFLIYLFSIFIFYSILPDSKYSQVIPVNAGESKKIDVTNAYRGNFIIRLYSIKSQININSNKLYFGQFRINLSIKYLFDDQNKDEIISNFLIEPTFELDQNISFPVPIYENKLPKHANSISIIFTSERISINEIALEFVFDNSAHFTIDLTRSIIFSIILLVLIIKYIYIVFCKYKKICRLEQKLILIYLFILSFNNYPFCFLINSNACLQNTQKSLSNSFYLCLILIFFRSIKMRGKKFSLFPYILMSIFFTIADLIDAKYSFHAFDAFIGVFYLILYLYEFVGAILKYDETEHFKFKVYTTIFVFIPLISILSRIMTKWCEFLFLKHLKVVFSDFANCVFAFLLAYLFYPIDPTDDVEYSRFHK